jgi:hypothetical protein
MHCLHQATVPSLGPQTFVGWVNNLSLQILYQALVCILLFLAIEPNECTVLIMGSRWLDSDACVVEEDASQQTMTCEGGVNKIIPDGLFGFTPATIITMMVLAWELTTSCWCCSIRIVLLEVVVCMATKLP